MKYLILILLFVGNAHAALSRDEVVALLKQDIESIEDLSRIGNELRALPRSFFVELAQTDTLNYGQKWNLIHALSTQTTMVEIASLFFPYPGRDIAEFAAAVYRGTVLEYNVPLAYWLAIERRQGIDGVVERMADEILRPGPISEVGAIRLYLALKDADPQKLQQAKSAIFRVATNWERIRRGTSSLNGLERIKAEVTQLLLMSIFSAYKRLPENKPDAQFLALFVAPRFLKYEALIQVVDYAANLGSLPSSAAEKMKSGLLCTSAYKPELMFH